MKRENVTCLIGNHELMMWEYLRGNEEPAKENQLIQKEDWIREGNGGKETLQKFLQLSKDQQMECLDYIRKMFLQFELELQNHTYLLSHSFFVQDETTIKWKDVDPNVVFEIVWRSPWRFWEYVSKDKYKDGDVHIVGHVHLQAVHELEDEWDYCWKPEAFIEEDGSLINIDCGCSIIGKNRFQYAGLCCLNLTAFDNGDVGHAFKYFLVEETGTDEEDDYE